MKPENLKDFIQSANINFLIGSGLSRPYLETLGNIETNLYLLQENKDLSEKVKDIVRASIYREYFYKVMLPNKIMGDEDLYDEVIKNYQRFITLWNGIVHNRCGNIRSKQINIFSTNIDLFVEKAAELCGVELIDGFQGSIKPIFKESNFQKTIMKNSVHFQNVSELPVFNLLKIHGSINWRVNNDEITNDASLDIIGRIHNCLTALDTVLVPYTLDLQPMITAAEEVVFKSDFSSEKIKLFNEAYYQLVIVNPTKRKFSETVVDHHFYELMRIFSNSLEKENSLLFVMGFSFADEHILKITQRALKTNPTLLVIIFAYDQEAYDVFIERFGEIPNVKVLLNGGDDTRTEESPQTLNYGFKEINDTYAKILDLIPLNFNHGRK